MLDFIYYPVSAILWFWHKVFGTVLGASSGIGWALSVIFLVFTLRAVLYRPFVKQIRTQRQMQEFQPQIKALQKKYKGDRQRLALEMQKLQKEHGFNPVAGCLPVLLQAPVFIGLFHVLRSFNRTGSQAQIPFLSPTEPMSVEQNAQTANYVFSADEVRSFLDAKLFGAPLSSFLTQTDAQLEAFGDVNKVAIAAVAIPLMVIAAVATHFTARASVARQSAAAAANPQSAMMNKLVLWVFPLFVLVGGPFLPVAILIYWLSNNAWTLVQQHYVFGKIAAEDEAKKREAIERRGSNAPRPGARPNKPKGRKAAANGSPSLSKESPESTAEEADDAVLPAEDTSTPPESKPSLTKSPSSGGAATPKAKIARPAAASGKPRRGGQSPNAKSKSSRGQRKKR
ncbi:membrane protein insertase YidC [Rhodococcus sp. X156]|uniref:membrane protein insertase YidC n=1 Tax=Rhodococcus sp. X156 TaxID=2499145 RepID=UPI000FD7F9D3|nr:membrane protein insertase YidC [Rhodococcus sp. X156]